MPERWLRPPVEVMRPVRATLVLAEDAMSGTAMYQIKLDGVRAVAFHLPDGVVLQARSGTDLSSRYPEIVPALAALPVGTVLDGEVVAWASGKLAFTELLRTPAARSRDGVAVSYISFDVLAIAAGRRAAALDLRGRPLCERWDALVELLRDVAPPVQLVMATRERATAMLWFEHLAPLGIEGIVAKPLGGVYGGARWLKIRHAESIDAETLALLGTPSRPRALLVRLPDGRTMATTPAMDTLQARQVAAAALLGETALDPEHGPVVRLAEPLLVELQLGTGRHGTARFLRIRGE